MVGGREMKNKSKEIFASFFVESRLKLFLMFTIYRTSLCFCRFCSQLLLLYVYKQSKTVFFCFLHFGDLFVSALDFHYPRLRTRTSSAI